MISHTHKYTIAKNTVRGTVWTNDKYVNNSCEPRNKLCVYKGGNCFWILMYQRHQGPLITRSKVQRLPSVLEAYITRQTQIWQSMNNIRLYILIASLQRAQSFPSGLSRDRPRTSQVREGKPSRHSPYPFLFFNFNTRQNPRVLALPSLWPQTLPSLYPRSQDPQSQQYDQHRHACKPLAVPFLRVNRACLTLIYISVPSIFHFPSLFSNNNKSNNIPFTSQYMSYALAAS